MKEDKNRKGKPMSEIEVLRRERTQLSQDQFIIYCGFTRSTYFRWISGKTTEGVSLKQLKTMCNLLGISLIEELPNSFSPPSESD